MSNSETASINLRVDTIEAENAVSNLVDTLDSLERSVAQIGSSLSTAFEPLLEGIQNTSAGIHVVVKELDTLSSSLGDLIATQQSDSGFFDSLSAGFEGMMGTSGTIDSLEAFFTKYDALTDALENKENNLEQIFESVLPETTDEITDIFKDLGGGLQKVFGGISSIFSGMSMGWVIAIAAIVAAIAILIANWDKIKAAIMPLWEEHLKPLWDRISEFVLSVGNSLMTIWNTVLLPIIDWIRQILEPIVLTVLNVVIGAISSVLGVVTDIIGAILSVLDGVIQFVAGVFAGDWEMAWEGIVKVFRGLFEAIAGIVKSVINGIIWIINILIGAIYSAIAGIINGLSGIVEAIGNMVGADWGFSVPTNPPQIPYLAKGAVLPANKPFLAMVGDQKHGTNVEAPLATIQEAVAIVMEDMIASNMAGHEATVGVLREILSAVLGIQIGDDVIGQAVARYDRKMAVMRGGYV